MSRCAEHQPCSRTLPPLVARCQETRKYLSGDLAGTGTALALTPHLFAKVIYSTAGSSPPTLPLLHPKIFSRELLVTSRTPTGTSIVSGPRALPTLSYQSEQHFRVHRRARCARHTIPYSLDVHYVYTMSASLYNICEAPNLVSIIAPLLATAPATSRTFQHRVTTLRHHIS